MTAFEELLVDVSNVFEISLHVDRLNACSIRISDRLTLQLQLDLSQENLWIFSKLYEIAPGKFRENVLKEALKANSSLSHPVGILCYKESSNELCLFQKFPLFILDGKTVAGFLGAFVEMARNWQEALDRGEAKPLTT